MKVELNDKSECKNAEIGDLIEITNAIYLVMREAWGDEFRLLNIERDWIISNTSETYNLFKKGKYKIIAKSNKIKIVRDLNE